MTQSVEDSGQHRIHEWILSVGGINGCCDLNIIKDIDPRRRRREGHILRRPVSTYWQQDSQEQERETTQLARKHLTSTPLKKALTRYYDTSKNRKSP
jgi:hypothetical protein